MIKKETYFVIDGIRYDLVRDPVDIDAKQICSNCALYTICRNSFTSDILCEFFDFTDYHFEKHV